MIGHLRTLLLSGLIFASPASAGPVEILESEQLRAGPISKLAFMVGDYRVNETRYRPDGSIAERSVGGFVSVRPALDGNYLMIAAAQGNEEESAEVLLWMITWHHERKKYVGRVFSGEDPDSGEARGAVIDGRLELITEPTELPGGQVLRVRFTAAPGPDGSVDIRIHQSLGEDWTLRAEEQWQRSDLQTSPKR